MSFFGGLFSNNKNENYSLILDIGSESIGAAFVHLENDKNPIIICSTRRVIPFQEKINIQRFILLMQDTLTQTIDDLVLKNNKIIPTSVVFTLASPWHTSQTRIVHIEEEHEFVITESGLKDILDKEANTFLSIPLSSGGPKELMTNSIIESHIIQVKISGYEITKPVGRKAKTLDLSMHVTTSPDIIICSLKEIVEKRWPNIRIVFNSFMFSAYNAIRDIFSTSSSFIMIDIAGEVTDISLIRENVLLESISFPLGYRSFVRTTMRELSLQSEVASSEIELYLNGSLSEIRSSIIGDVFAKTTHDWSLLFTASLKQLSLKYPIPKNIYLLSDDKYLEYFSKTIKGTSSSIFGENKEEFDVDSLNLKKLSIHVHNKNDECKDLFLYVTIIMLEKLLNIENQHNNQYICKKI